MNAVELTRGLERGELVNASFHHASHLQVAWIYLQESESVEMATAKMCATLRNFTAAAGKPEKYHETITVFWMLMLAALRGATPESDLDQILAANPRLLQKDFPLEYYSRDLLFSERARKSWVEPDLKPLCTDATPVYSSDPTGDSSHRVVCR